MALEKAFQSVHQGQAAVKLNVRFSLKNLALDKLQATAGKRPDSRFRGITSQPGILYLFDLGYWAFARFQKIIQAHSFFVSRLKSRCDPLITAVSQGEWQHLVGHRLSQITPLLSPSHPLDVRVTLSSAKKPRWNEEIRRVGLFFAGGSDSFHQFVRALETFFQDAEQNIHAQVAFGMEHADYLLMRAPAPAVHHIDFLLTWNFRHITETLTRRSTAIICRFDKSSYNTYNCTYENSR